MLIKKLDDLPGGRALIFLVPIVSIALGLWLFGDAVVTQVGNVVTLVLCVAMLWLYRRSLPIFMKETKDAATQWWSLGTFVLVLVTVLNVGRSQLLRATGAPLLTDSPFLAAVRVFYAFAFGCYFLAPLARDAVVPPRGWWALASITIIATLGTLAAIAIF